MTLRGKGGPVLRPGHIHTGSKYTPALPDPPRYAPYSHRLVRGTLKQTGQLPPLSAVGRQVQCVLLIGVLDGAAFGQVPENGRMSHRPELPLSLPTAPSPHAQQHLWKFQVKRRVMSAVPLSSSRFIWARLGGLIRHKAPELPSMDAVTISSGLYWLMNCMASCTFDKWVWSVGGASYPTPVWEACIPLQCVGLVTSAPLLTQVWGPSYLSHPPGMGSAFFSDPSPLQAGLDNLVYRLGVEQTGQIIIVLLGEWCDGRLLGAHSEQRLQGASHSVGGRAGTRVGIGPV